jgi:hypothetical protein
MMIALVAVLAFAGVVESDALTTRDHNPPVSDEREVWVPIQTRGERSPDSRRLPIPSAE